MHTFLIKWSSNIMHIFLIKWSRNLMHTFLMKAESESSETCRNLEHQRTPATCKGKNMACVPPTWVLHHRPQCMYRSSHVSPSPPTPGNLCKGQCLVCVHAMCVLHHRPQRMCVTVWSEFTRCVSFITPPTSVYLCKAPLLSLCHESVFRNVW